MSFKRFKTEKMLLASIGVLALFLFVSAFSKELGISVSLAEEESATSSPDNGEDSSNEGSQDEEDSQENEGSQEENSQVNEQSELSTSSAPSVQTTQTASSAEEISEKSSGELSQQSIDDGEASESSELSQEISEESIKYVEGYGEVVSKEGNIALVKQDERLFFLIPVEVESQVTLDEQGSVVDAKKSFLNWLLSVFSF